MKSPNINLYILFLRLLAFLCVKLSRGVRFKSQDFGLDGISGLASILLLDLFV